MSQPKRATLYRMVLPDHTCPFGVRAKQLLVEHGYKVEDNILRTREETDRKSWVRSRQFTGRIVTVTNDKVFDEPVYNYTHEFAYLWDEISVPVHYGEDYRRADEIILKAASNHALTAHGLGQDEVQRLERRFGIKVDEIEPRVFWRMTENWVELTARFLGPDHGIRGMKDKMTREILAGLEQAKIPVAAIRQEGVALGRRR